jgi:hypothetical protein
MTKRIVRGGRESPEKGALRKVAKPQRRKESRQSRRSEMTENEIAKLGFVMNFDSEYIRDGIRRVVNGLPEEEP